MSRRRSPNVIMLVLVAAGYAATQFAIGMHRVFLGWDEVVYVSQFSRTVPAGFMDAARAWGIPLVVAPVAAVTTSVEVIRGYLIALLAAGVCCAYLPWLKLRDSVAVPCAALLLCGLWVAVFYGSAAMPNMLTALCAVAAVALFLQVQTGGRTGERPGAPARVRPAVRTGFRAAVRTGFRAAVRTGFRAAVRTGLQAGFRAGGSGRPLAGLVIAFGVISLTRPLDTVWFGLPLLAAACLHRPWRRPAAALAIVAGGAIGWVPWIIEAEVRFGGLPERLRRIASLPGSDPFVQLIRHLQSFSSGTIHCAPADHTCGRISLAAAVTWCALGALAALGLTVLRRQGGLPYRAAVLTAIVAAGNAVPYLFLSRPADPRLLLPTYALLALPAAEGLHWLSLRPHRSGRILAPAGVALLVGSQLVTAGGLVATTRKTRHQQVRQARAIMRLGVRPPCLVYGSNAPQIAYLTHCRYRARWRQADAPPRGLQVVIVTRGTETPDVPAGWRHLRLLPGRPWHVHLPP